MVRPPQSEWQENLDLDGDPTPGSPDVLEQLAAEYERISSDAESAFSVISRLQSQDLGAGQAMDKLRETLDELPSQVGKLRDSYEAAARALRTYVPQLRDEQSQADTALELGRQAKAQLALAVATAASAGAQVASLRDADPPPPDDERARTEARRALQDAESAERAAAAQVSSAQAEWEAARQLALSARELRESDAEVASTALGEAEDDAVRKKNFWEKLGDLLGMVFGVVSAVLGVVALLIPGFQGLGVALTIGSIAFGAASLGLAVAKGIDTGQWDITAIVLGTVGLALGGIGLAGGFGKVAQGLQNVARNIRSSVPLPGGRPPGAVVNSPGQVAGGGPPRLPMPDLGPEFRVPFVPRPSTSSGGSVTPPAPPGGVALDPSRASQWLRDVAHNTKADFSGGAIGSGAAVYGGLGYGGIATDGGIDTRS